MDKIQNRLYILIYIFISVISCSKEIARTSYTMKNADFTPDPVPYTEPVCLFLNADVFTSRLDNFDGIKLEFAGYTSGEEHTFVFKSANNDSVIVSLPNLFNTRCNYYIYPKADNPQVPVPLRSISVWFKLNKLASKKIAGFLDDGICHAVYGSGAITFTFCNSIAKYIPLSNNNQYETTVTMLLRAPLQ